MVTLGGFEFGWESFSLSILAVLRSCHLWGSMYVRCYRTGNGLDGVLVGIAVFEWLGVGGFGRF